MLENAALWSLALEPLKVAWKGREFPDVGLGFPVVQQQLG